MATCRICKQTTAAIAEVTANIESERAFLDPEWDRQQVDRKVYLTRYLAMHQALTCVVSRTEREGVMV